MNLSTLISKTKEKGIIYALKKIFLVLIDVISRSLRAVLLPCICFLFFIISSLRKKEGVLILTPSDPGSIGDEALLQSTIDYLHSHQVKKIGLIKYKKDVSWHNETPITECIDAESFFTSNSIKSIVEFLIKSMGYKKFYILGADVLDGFYSDRHAAWRLDLARYASLSGISTSIIAFSLRDIIKPYTLKAFKKIPKNIFLTTRDVQSEKILKDTTNKDAIVTTDVAFLLHPTNTPLLLETQSWAEQQKLVIGININPYFLKDQSKESIDNLLTVYTSLIANFHKSFSCSFMLIPHDVRASTIRYHEVRLTEQLFTHLPSHIQNVSRIIPSFSLSASEIKYAAGLCGFVITGRMHLAIASLSQGVPVVSISYHDNKFFGLYEQFDLQNLVFSQEDLYDHKKISEALLQLITDKKRITQKIAEKLPGVVARAYKNFHE